MTQTVVLHMSQSLPINDAEYHSRVYREGLGSRGTCPYNGVHRRGMGSTAHHEILMQGHLEQGHQNFMLPMPLLSTPIMGARSPGAHPFTVTEHLRFDWRNGLSVSTLPSEVKCSTIILGHYALNQFVRPILH